jgi:hypothetical protein
MNSYADEIESYFRYQYVLINKIEKIAKKQNPISVIVFSSEF